MSFPRYERYRNSGVEWLPEIPEHWKAVKLKRLSRLYSGGTPDKTQQHYWENGTIPWLSSGEVNQGLITTPSTFITEEAFARSSAKWIPAGSLVMALAGQGKTKGTVAQLAFRCTCNQSMGVIVPDEIGRARFLYWWLTANYENIRNLAGGDLRDGLNLELVGNIACPVISSSEGAWIASFLDHETTKIDALIQEQQHLIELLKEKRQVVISNSVTRGLNPAAPMKESGIDWIGLVPGHWRIGRCGRHVKILSGFAFPSVTFSFDESQPKLLRGINVGVGYLRWNDTVYWERRHDDGLNEYELLANDIVLGMDRPVISEGVRIAKVSQNDLPCLLLQPLPVSGRMYSWIADSCSR